MARSAAAALLFGTSISSTGAAPRSTITIAAHYTANQMRPLEACYREYERQHPEVRIIYQQATIEDYLQTVMTARLAGTSPDIYSVYSLWSGQLAQAGLLDEPPATILDFVRDSYLPSTVAGTRSGDKVWGIPSEISTYMLVYNKALLKQAGFDAPPRTWDELRQVAGMITHRNGQGNITTAGFAFGPTVANAVHPFLSLLLAEGATPMNPDADGAGLNGEEALAVLTGMSRLFADGATSSAVTVRDFPSGTVGMAIMANWVKDTLRQGMGDRFGDTVGVAPIPSDGGHWRTLQYSFFWSVDARSRNKEAAWALLRWLNAPRGTDGRSCTGDMLVRMGALTGNKGDIAASRAELGDDFTRPYVDAIASGRAVALPNLPQMAEIQQVLRRNIEKAWSGSLQPVEALRQARRAVTALLAEDH